MKYAIMRGNNMKRFWVSWVQRTNDYRPIGYPPHKPVLGWWCSGYDSQDNAILVALVEVKDEEDAQKVVSKEWPEWDGWRFIDEVDSDFKPSNRFQLSDWMKERI